MTWHDALAGEQAADPVSLGDAVVMRKDAPASYHLAATLDDAADGVTLVTRGRDLFAASISTGCCRRCSACRFRHGTIIRCCWT